MSLVNLCNEMDMEDPAYDKDGKLTPIGLAQWMDEEGGLMGLWRRNGNSTFVEAGCNPDIVVAFAEAVEAMDDELERIGAVL